MGRVSASGDARIDEARMRADTRRGREGPASDSVKSMSLGSRANQTSLDKTKDEETERDLPLLTIRAVRSLVEFAAARSFADDTGLGSGFFMRAGDAGTGDDLDVEGAV